MTRSLGGRVVWLVLAGLAAATACTSSGAPQPASADSGETACSVLRRIPDPFPDLPTGGATGTPYDLNAHRLAAARLLAADAAGTDAARRPLADALEGAFRALTQSQEMSEGQTHLAEARRHC
ncbi:hypothetical protein OH807_32115 [Kitasatospora sp. NBC_01560]|uniref:hypothetical protein n=1 Tax=Kitasatospora sp. NBC_01560 TaxID=2975965 RepID=UPI00386D78AB